MSSSSPLLMSELDLKRFIAYCVVDRETGCWEWTGAKFRNGRHAQFWLNGPQLGHKVAFETFVGPVPEGMELGHIRQGDKCAFWEHVRPVTHEENIQEAYGRIGFCTNEHLKVPANRAPGLSGCASCSRIRVARQRDAEPCLGCGYVRRCRCEVLYQEIGLVIQ